MYIQKNLLDQRDISMSRKSKVRLWLSKRYSLLILNFSIDREALLNEIKEALISQVFESSDHTDQVNEIQQQYKDLLYTLLALILLTFITLPYSLSLCLIPMLFYLMIQLVSRQTSEIIAEINVLKNLYCKYILSSYSYICYCKLVIPVINSQKFQIDSLFDWSDLFYRGELFSFYIYLL